jgi:hypothetical protein
MSTVEAPADFCHDAPTGVATGVALDDKTRTC